MAEIAANLVKELRERTGAGMMDCKRALEETDGSLDDAVTLLREKGIAQAAKRSGRETTEGKVAIDLDEASGAMVAVGCETEPVSNNEEFFVFVQRVLDAVAHHGPEGADQLDAERDILTKQPDLESKPEDVRGKIVEGRIHKWLSELVLADQEWIHESGKKVGPALQEAGFEVIEFRRFALSE